MRSDEEIRKSIFDDIVEIIKHTMPKDSNVDPEAIASAVSTYLQNNPIEAYDDTVIIQELKELKNQVYGLISITWIDGGYIDYSSGGQYPEDGRSYTDFVEIKCPKLVFENTMTSDNEYNVFYDENKNFLSSFSNATGFVEVPEGAKYFRLSKYTTAILTVKMDMDYATKAYVNEAKEYLGMKEV